MVHTYVSYRGRTDDLEMKMKAPNFVENGRKMLVTNHVIVMTSHFERGN